MDNNQSVANVQTSQLCQVVAANLVIISENKIGEWDNLIDKLHDDDGNTRTAVVLVATMLMP